MVINTHVSTSGNNVILPKSAGELLLWTTQKSDTELVKIFTRCIEKGLGTWLSAEPLRGITPLHSCIGSRPDATTILISQSTLKSLNISFLGKTPFDWAIKRMKFQTAFAISTRLYELLKNEDADKGPARCKGSTWGKLSSLLKSNLR